MKARRILLTTDVMILGIGVVVGLVIWLNERVEAQAAEDKLHRCEGAALTHEARLDGWEVWHGTTCEARPRQFYLTIEIKRE